MEASTTIVNVNPEQLDKLVEFMSSVVGSTFPKPQNVTGAFYLQDLSSPRAAPSS
jgi:hypothetical protein